MANFNISRAIQLVNNASIHAKRMITTTLRTAGFIEESVEEFPFSYMDKKGGDEDITQYLRKIESLVQNFGDSIDKAIAKESKAQRKFAKSKITRLIQEQVENWKPLEVFTEIRMETLFSIFQTRVDSLSRLFLYKQIDQIKYQEVNNVK
jgi:hypothetical protein